MLFLICPNQVIHILVEEKEKKEKEKERGMSLKRESEWRFKESYTWFLENREQKTRKNSKF